MPGARNRSPLVRASVIGLLTAILPCGWLFAFLIVAAGTAQPMTGALVMAVFALGSVPALTGLALSMTMLVGRFRRAIPWCSAVLVTLVGAVTLIERSQVDLEPMLVARPATTASSNAVEQLEAIDHKQLPCCQPATKPR